MTNDSSVLEQPYKIISVYRVEPPRGAKGSNWHRYVIAQGTNVIHGHRQGSLNDVMRVAQEFVVRLNERRSGKSGRINLALTPTKNGH